MNLREAAEKALEALEHGGPAHRLGAMHALRTALAEAAQQLDGYRELAQRVNAAEAEVERLRADAERYRWLRGGVHGPRVPLAQVLWKLNNIRDNFRWINLSDGQTLDEHIDAARGES